MFLSPLLFSFLLFLSSLRSSLHHSTFTMNSKIDDIHIFSEFEDEERQTLIGELCRQDEALAKLPRASLFPLWFSDIKHLQDIVACNSSFRDAFLLVLPVANVPGLCEYLKPDIQQDIELTTFIHIT